MSGGFQGSPVIVAGMHRSGTSLVASVMQAAGVDLGESLLGATESNPRGHFEDLDLIEWHDSVFEDHGMTWYDAGVGVELAVSTERRSQAERILAGKAVPGVWGWKDPRTSLFLDFWGDILPKAQFVFVFRDPRLVLESFRRRQDPELFHRFRGTWALKKLGFDPFRGSKALDLWIRYNQSIADFMTSHPERSRIVEVGRITVRMPGIIRGLRDQVAADLNDVDVDALQDRTILHDRPVMHELPLRGRDAAKVLLSHLRDLADRQSPEGSA